MTTLEATIREERGKQLAKVRKEGKLPAVVYGPKEETKALSLDQREFEKVYKEAGESTVIDLTGLKAAKEVLVHDVAYDPVSGHPVHVDLYAIEQGQTLQVQVPLEFVGEAPAIKLGGSLTKVLHEVEIETTPRNLPQHIEVDVSSLVDFETQIQLKDLNLPKEVTVTGDPEEVVAIVTEVKEEVEEVVEVDMDAIESEQKGKDEPEGGEGENS